MRLSLISTFLAGAVLAVVSVTFGHVESSEAEEISIVPAHERATAKDLGMAGPTETKGVSGVVKLGAISLEQDFPELADRKIRAREITLLPGGTVAVHQHESRPGVAYVIEGELVEHRNDQPDPVIRRAGDTAFEQSGIVHWWENRSQEPARVMVVDIVPVDLE
ncbi:MAG: cupin domain-containing protein [Opitutaceae bacterium]